MVDGLRSQTVYSELQEAQLRVRVPHGQIMNSIYRFATSCFAVPTMVNWSSSALSWRVLRIRRVRPHLGTISCFLVPMTLLNSLRNNRGHSSPTRTRKFTPGQVEKLHEQFRALDHNGDGELCEKDFIRSFSYLAGDKVSSALFRGFDYNGDGIITQVEFVNCMELLLLGTSREKVLFSFKMFDDNRNGTIEYSEFQDLMAFASEERLISDEEAARLFRQADVQDKGYITFEEFEVLSQSNCFSEEQSSTTNFDRNYDPNSLALGFGTPGWKIVMPLLRGIQNFVQQGPTMEPERELKLDHKIVITEFASSEFARLRSVFGFSSEDYLQYLGLHTLIRSILFGALVTPKEMSSSGSSGSFFFMSPDSNLIIKSIKRKEAKELIDILPTYIDHHAKYPNSLLVRFYGLYKTQVKTNTKSNSRRSIYFIVMMNVIPTNHATMRVVYDLKGSSAGRTVPEHKRKGPLTALKDNDLQHPFYLEDPKDYHNLLLNIDRDVAFLRHVQTMDYSLLVCVGVPRAMSGKKTQPASTSQIHKYVGLLDGRIRDSNWQHALVSSHPTSHHGAQRPRGNVILCYNHKEHFFHIQTYFSLGSCKAVR